MLFGDAKDKVNEIVAALDQLSGARDVDPRTTSSGR
jgi:hypothetical protein